jgi:hypothetical protein
MLYQSTSWPRRMPSHNSSVGFCSYKSSIWKSKSKKGAENWVAIHLLRNASKRSPFDDYLRDETLLKVTISSPDLVNFMVTGYIPPGEDKKKWFHLREYHLWDNHLSIQVCANGSLRSCNPLCETRKILEHATPCHGEHIMEYSVPILRFGRRDNSSQPSFEMPRNLCGDAQDVRDTGISMPVMLYHWRATFSWKFSAYGEMTPWVLPYARAP